MSLLELKDKVIVVRNAYQHGQVPIEELYKATDAYIAALAEYKKRTKRRISIPSRAYLIRAL